MTTPPDVWPPQPASPWAPVTPAPASEGRDGFAVAALVLGVVPVLAGLLGVVFGVIGFRRAGRTGQKGRVMAAWGASLGGLWLLLIVGVITAAAVTGEGTRLWQGTGSIVLEDLRVGDCVEDLPNGSTTELQVVACGDRHRAEVYDLHDLAAGPYPGDKEVERFSRGRCRSTLNRYLGVAQGAESGYEPTYYAPTQESWGLGDREVLCLLQAQGNVVMTRSARGTGVLPGFAPSPRPTLPARPGQTSGDVLQSQLRVGDCLAKAQVGELFTVPVVPCARRHVAEVYAITSLKAGPYPGERGVIRLAEGYCAKRIGPYLGLRSGARDGYGVYYVYPTAQSWTDGTRRVTCMLQAPGERPMTGSAKGKGAWRA